MNFEQAIERILSHEGGLVDNPRDPGGLTQWGYIAAQLSAGRYSQPDAGWGDHNLSE